LDCSVFLQDVGDLLQRRNFGDDALAEQQADLVDHHQLAGIGDGNRRRPSASHRAARSCSGTSGARDLSKQIVVQLEVAQIDEFATVAPRDIARAFQFVGTDAGSGTSFPPFPPFTSTVFLSAIAIPVYNLQVSFQHRFGTFGSQPRNLKPV
jgi:hypothetical protein